MNDLFNRTAQGVKRSREGVFGRIAGLFSRSRIDDSTWDELEELLIAADVGVETTGKMLGRVKKRVREEKLSDGGQVRDALKEEMVKLLSLNSNAGSDTATRDIEVILFVGVNGSGKTTSIAKLASEYKGAGKRVILGAADTFRAAAIDQLKTWGSRVGVEVVAHQPDADPGAVVFDTLQAAQSRKADVVIIDTEGRLQTKHNLMDELKKIKRSQAGTRPTRKSCWSSMLQPGRTASRRQGASPRRPTSQVFSSPSWMAQPGAALCSPSAMSCRYLLNI